MAYKDREKKRAYERKWRRRWRADHPEEAKKGYKKNYIAWRKKHPKMVNCFLKKVKPISMYLDFINPQQVLWRQKIDENGRLQGLGFFQISRVGKMTIEKRRESSRKWNPIMQAKRKEFGYIELNERFEGSEGHHLDKELVLHIPKELHQSIWHSVITGKNMNEINDKAIEWAYGILNEGERR